MARGFNALKTNIVIPGEPANVYFPGFSAGINSTDGAPSVEILEAIERLIGTFRDAVGPRVGLCLDLNYNFRTEGVLRIGKLLEQFNMQWMEYDNWDPQALLQIKQSTSTRLASCESLVSTRQYRPFLELHAVDVAIIDVPWNGFSQAVQIGRMAEAYEINIAPHNYYSHLADLHSRAPVRGASQRADHGDRHRRRAVEEHAGDAAADDQGRPHLPARRTRLGRGHQRRGAARAPLAEQVPGGAAVLLRDEQPGHESPSWQLSSALRRTGRQRKGPSRKHGIDLPLQGEGWRVMTH